jgi:GntR family transcriptional regulator
MTQRSDDGRPLFMRVVDDIRDRIANGEFTADEQIPSAKALSERYGVANMTAQRALRELQIQEVTYSIKGKGSYVRTDAAQILTGKVEPIDTDEQYVAVWTRFREELRKIYRQAEADLDTNSLGLVNRARMALDDFWAVNDKQYTEMNSYNLRASVHERYISGLEGTAGPQPVPWSQAKNRKMAPWPPAE